MTSLTSQKEPLDSAQLFVNLREVSRVLAHEVDRLTDELPKSEKQVRSAAEGIALARGDIQALAQHAKMLNDTWRRSEELAESVGKAAAKASVKAIEETVEELTDQLKNSVIEATKAARDLDRAMHINKAFWKIALMLGCALVACTAALMYKIMKPSDEDVRERRNGEMLEKVYRKTDGKERAAWQKFFDTNGIVVDK